MKAPSFEWVRAKHLGHVFELLDAFGDEATLLAGGQTLLATLNMRLSEPTVLIDITGLAPLQGIARGERHLSVGALVTHTEIEESPEIARYAPLLRMAVPHIAHRAIRNRGTFGGSIAYADPAAEWPACVLALEARIVVAGQGGERVIAAQDFFLGLYETALRPGEVVVRVEIPFCAPNEAFAFDELARRHGDYAIVGLASQGCPEGGRVKDVRLAYLGVAATAIRVARTEAFLEGREITPATLDAAIEVLREELTGRLEPIADLSNSSAMKRHLAGVLLRRNLVTLVGGAGGVT
jgi:carbon-monoxide dehydrogenase medium subunit